MATEGAAQLRLSGDNGEVLEGLSPQRRRFVLVALGLVLAGSLVVAALVVRRLVFETVRPVPQGLPGPVLVVPGYGGSVVSLAPILARLRSDGRDATVVTLAGNGTGDLRVQAQRLQEAAQAALARTGAPSVDVVGYSAGGVIARLWVRSYGGGNEARRVVTLGSPHHGTSVAALAGQAVPGLCVGACEQLAPDSSLLRALNAGDETPAGPRFVSIWTITDDVVIPPDSSRLTGALDVSVQSLCPASIVSHGGLPSDPLVLDLLVRELGAALPSIPAAPACAGA